MCVWPLHFHHFLGLVLHFFCLVLFLVVCKRIGFGPSVGSMLKKKTKTNKVPSGIP